MRTGRQQAASQCSDCAFALMMAPTACLSSSRAGDQRDVELGLGALAGAGIRDQAAQRIAEDRRERRQQGCDQGACSLSVEADSAGLLWFAW